MSSEELPQADGGIAIIGMAGRFPGARTVAELWANLCIGLEAITFFTEEELIADGNDPAMVSLPNYVKARGALGDAAYFDAAFFGHSPGVAEVMDPQHRLFLECAWTALEHAGYDSERTRARIGVFAGESMNTYLLSNLYQHLKMVASVESLQASIGNDKDSLTAEVAYKLNLRGPSITVQTASSTSLSAVHIACQSLLNYECDMALAGGVSIHFPEIAGYLYQAGGATSPDGHCRAFDTQAQGFVNGHGAGVVVLKRLEEALADCDTIVAVIKGSAINNDGAAKVSYMAPSQDAQAQVIALAQAIADVTPEMISYIETHGTGTYYGDPIEVAALTQAFRFKTQKKQFCALGTLKPNIGHLDAAAGVAGLIKAALSLKHQQIPPSINCTLPNSQIDWANSPFYVNTELANWPTGPTPRRAGVSSFGMGGTNVHVVVEEAPPIEPSGPSRPWQLLTISAKTSTALDTATSQLAAHLRQHPDQHFGDIAYTLQVGRRPFLHRRVLVCQDHTDAATALEAHDPKRVFSSFQEPGARQLVFTFTGQGAQYVGMAHDLYTSEAVFRTQLDRCAELLRPHLNIDLRDVLYPGSYQESVVSGQWSVAADHRPPTTDHRPQTTDNGQRTTDNGQLDQTWLTQPALFAIEYALARQLMAWGVQPYAFIGHSIGEYVAACLAGVFSLEDALLLVAARGRLIQSLPSGAMLAVPLAEADIQPLLGPDLALAAINGPTLSVVSGTAAAVAALEQWASDQGLNCRPLRTSHAFHSSMLDPILEPFMAQVRRVRLQPPQVPFISNVTGTWITSAQATDPAYWVAHLRQPVRFAAGLDTLLQTSATVLLEVGPGQTLSTFARQHPARSPQQPVLTTLRHPRDRQNDLAFLLDALGKLWLAGIDIDWEQLYVDEHRQRIPLPTYPFERQRYWVEPSPQRAPSLAAANGQASTLDKLPDPANWFYVPSWKRTSPAVWPVDAAPQCWLVFGEELAAEAVRRLQSRGQTACAVHAGAEFFRADDHSYRIHPGRIEDYIALLADLRNRDVLPDRIVHLWSVRPSAVLSTDTVEQALGTGLYSLILLAQALGTGDGARPLHIAAVSQAAHGVIGDEELQPQHATLLSACRVIPKEYQHLTCQNIDIGLVSGNGSPAPLDQILADARAPSPDAVVAYRGPHRWVEMFEAAPLATPSGRHTRLREGGVYVITGGLGEIGLEIGAYLATTVRAKLVLIGRSALPTRDMWDAWPATHSASDPTSRKLQRLRDIEANGAEVLPLSADVTDLAGMRTALMQAVERWGRVDGIIHAAGIAGGGLIQFKTLDEVARVLAPKVHGALVLDALARDLNPDFLILFSSLTALIGEFGQVDYCAANAFLDTLAHRNAACGGVFTVAVNWDAWHGKGMVAEAELPSEARQIRDQLFSAALLPAEGTDVFGRILAHAHTPQVIVSTQALAPRIAHVHTLMRNYVERAVHPARASGSPHPRPDLPTSYVPPRNETERIVTQLWQEVLGIDRVGIHDNFFDLGGNSLTGIDVIGRLSSMFNRALPPVSLYEGPTASALAKLLTPDTPEPSGYEDSKSRGKLRREMRRGY